MADKVVPMSVTTLNARSLVKRQPNWFARLLDYKPAEIVLVDKDRERLDRVFEEATGLNCTGDIRLVKAHVDLAEAEETDDLFAAARTEIEACERELSRFDPRSELQRLNAAAGSWRITVKSPSPGWAMSACRWRWRLPAMAR